MLNQRQQTYQRSVKETRQPSSCSVSNGKVSVERFDLLNIKVACMGANGVRSPQPTHCLLPFVSIVSPRHLSCCCCCGPVHCLLLFCVCVCGSANLLYPKSKRSTRELFMMCRYCGRSEKALEPRVWEHELKQTTQSF